MTNYNSIVDRIRVSSVSQSNKIHPAIQLMIVFNKITGHASYL